MHELMPKIEEPIEEKIEQQIEKAAAGINRIKSDPLLSRLLEPPPIEIEVEGNQVTSEE